MPVPLKPDSEFTLRLGPVSFRCRRASAYDVGRIRAQAEVLAGIRRSDHKKAAEEAAARQDGSVPGVDIMTALAELNGTAEGITVEVMFDAGLVTGWDGFVDDDGNPVPLTRETWAAFVANWGWDAVAVGEAIVARSRLQAAEGNA